MWFLVQINVNKGSIYTFSCRERLGFYAEIQITFGTVWTPKIQIIFGTVWTPKIQINFGTVWTPKIQIIFGTVWTPKIL